MTLHPYRCGCGLEFATPTGRCPRCGAQGERIECRCASVPWLPQRWCPEHSVGTEGAQPQQRETA